MKFRNLNSIFPFNEVGTKTGRKFLARFTHPDFPQLRGVYIVSYIRKAANSFDGHDYTGYYWCDARRKGKTDIGDYSFHPKDFIKEIH